MVADVPSGEAISWLRRSITSGDFDCIDSHYVYFPPDGFAQAVLLGHAHAAWSLPVICFPARGKD